MYITTRGVLTKKDGFNWANLKGYSHVEIDNIRLNLSIWVVFRYEISFFRKKSLSQFFTWYFWATFASFKILTHSCYEQRKCTYSNLRKEDRSYTKKKTEHLMCYGDKPRLLFKIWVIGTPPSLHCGMTNTALPLLLPLSIRCNWTSSRIS